jgi:hypothetical protein
MVTQQLRLFDMIIFMKKIVDKRKITMRYLILKRYRGAVHGR